MKNCHQILTFIFLLLSQSLWASNALQTSISVEHYQGFYKDVDPVTKSAFSFSKEINKNLRLSLTQPLTKYYVVNKGDKEIQLEDSQITLWRKLNDNLDLSLKGSVPLSDYSQMSGKISTIGLGLSLSDEILDGNVFF